MEHNRSGIGSRTVQPDEWHATRPAPAANRGFTEGRRYGFQLTSSEYSLYIDDEPLRYLASQSWEWQPGFFAGEVTAELRRPDGVSAGLFFLDVARIPTKLASSSSRRWRKNYGMKTQLW